MTDGPGSPAVVRSDRVEEEPQVREAYVRARAKDHRETLDAIVEKLLGKHGLKLRFEEVIFHDEFQAEHAK